MIIMRALVLAVAYGAAVSAAALAEEKPPEPTAPQPVLLVEPSTVEDCLRNLELLVESAHALDLLDDQIDQAESELAKMEQHCLDSQFEAAMAAAKVVQQIVASNK